MKASTIFAAESTRALEAVGDDVDVDVVVAAPNSLVEATASTLALPLSCFSGEDVSEPEIGETLPSDEELMILLPLLVLLLLLLLLLLVLLLLLAPRIACEADALTLFIIFKIDFLISFL